MNRALEIGKGLIASSAGIGTVVYAFGYLALRARARALGTEPAFGLVDEVYVFAGVRFFVVTLIMLVPVAVAAGLVLGAWRIVSPLFPTAAARLRSAVEAVALSALILLTIAGFMISVPNGVILNAAAGGPGPLADAILGRSDLGVGLMAIAVAAATCTACWLYSRLLEKRGVIEWILIPLFALQLFILPVVHGALFADRTVRVLSEVPKHAASLKAPVAVVDRTASEVTLAGRDGEGRVALITLARAELEGQPVVAVKTLTEFLDGDLGIPTAGLKPATHSTGLGFGSALAADRLEGEPDGRWFDGLKWFGMVLRSVGSLSPHHGGGEVWMTELDEEGRPGERRRIGQHVDLSWPVAGLNGTVLTLHASGILRLGSDGQVLGVEGGGYPWAVLLGEQPDGSILGIIRRAGEHLPAVVHPDGVVSTEEPPLASDRDAAVDLLLQEGRAYEGDWSLFVDISERAGGRGTDVYLDKPSGMVNISDCASRRCGQPSLSPDRRRAFFVRMP